LQIRPARCGSARRFRRKRPGSNLIRVGTRAASLQETVRLRLEDNTRDPISIAYSYTHHQGTKEVRLVLDYY
jgi:hypothetical protein